MHMTARVSHTEIVYPESDGKPMADNTKQFDWILKMAANLKTLVRDMPDVFASGNQFWYPVKDHPEIVQAPDVYVVFGRPKGDRSSYMQWVENDIPMTVVFEVLSPGNDYWEMADKFTFYDEHGVEEYYIYDPERNRLDVFVRKTATLVRRLPAHGFVSPRLGIRFDLSGPEMVVYYPDGRAFLPVEDLEAERLRQTQRAEKAEERADKAQEHLARIAELSRKLLAGQASEDEKQELARVVAPGQ